MFFLHFSSTYDINFYSYLYSEYLYSNIIIHTDFIIRLI